MGFDSGSISFKRFVVSGQGPSLPDEQTLGKIDEHALRPTEDAIPPELEYGWVGPKHVFDADFSFGNLVFNDCIFFALRIDTNRLPGEMKLAFKLMEEDAAAKGNPSGFISKSQKSQTKDTVRRKIDEELRSGKYRRSKNVQLLWDVPAGVVYASISTSAQAYLLELFERTFGLQLHPVGSGLQALRVMEGRGKRREYEDWKPTRFAKGPEVEDQPAEYPWVAKGPEAKDFLGNEFMLWLWHVAQTNGGMINTAVGDVALVIDRTLDLDCSFGVTGRDVLRGAGPSRMPEAIDGLRSGKVPRKAGLIVDYGGNQYNCSLGAEGLNVGGLKLPEVEEADNPRVLFEERITLLRDFVKALNSLFDTFLAARGGAGWASVTTDIRKWIAVTVRPVAAVA